MALPISVRYTLAVYVNGILFFTSFRILLLLGNLSQLPPTGQSALIATSMAMGLRFDTVVSAYLLALPFPALFLLEWLHRISIKTLLYVHLLISLTYALCFFISVADLPFFSNYRTRLNVTILNWSGSPAFMLGMVWQDNKLPRTSCMAIKN